MRVPIPVVILLCLSVVGGVWWTGTRQRDFLSHPSENQVAVIGQKSDSTPPAPQSSDLKVAPQPQEDPPQLADYRDEALKDPAALTKLALQMETQGKLQRSLLAWERVLDSAPPDEARTSEALQAIKRLRPALPAWNTDPAKTIAITIHAGTGKSTAEILTPVLEEIARDLQQASSGTLKITASVTAGNDIPKSRGPAPIALWFAGSGVGSDSTQVRVSTIGPAEVLRDDVLKTLLQIIRSQLGRTTSLTAPETVKPDENPLEAMHIRITRLGWLELGSSLNKTLE